MTASELKHEILTEVIKLHDAGYKITFRIDESSCMIFDTQTENQHFAFNNDIDKLTEMLKELRNIKANYEKMLQWYYQQLQANTTDY